MDESLKNHVETVIRQARQSLQNVQIHRYDVDEYRALIRLEGEWQSYRVFITMIYRANHTTRYAYHILNPNNQHIHRFDNAADKTAIKLRYKTDWKTHHHEEIPHQHDEQGRISLTEPITFEQFVNWLNQR